MKVPQLLITLVLLYQPASLYAESGPPCCEYKEVGGIYYKLVGEGNPDSKFECMSPCIYYNISDPASRYCFKPGPLKTQCVDFTHILLGGLKEDETSQSRVEAITHCGVNVSDTLHEMAFQPRAAFGMDTVYFCQGDDDAPGLACQHIRGNATEWSDGPNFEGFGANYNTLTRMGNKLVSLGGGYTDLSGDLQLLPSVLFLDMENNTWTNSSDWIYEPYGNGVYQHCAVALSDSEVVLLGGIVNDDSGSSLIIDSVFILNINTDDQEELPSLPVPNTRLSCGLVHVQDNGHGYIVVAGGDDDQMSFYGLNMSNRTAGWEVLPSLPRNTTDATMLIMGDVIHVHNNELDPGHFYVFTHEGDLSNGLWSIAEQEYRKGGSGASVPCNFQHDY